MYSHICSGNKEKSTSSKTQFQKKKKKKRTETRLIRSYHPHMTQHWHWFRTLQCEFGPAGGGAYTVGSNTGVLSRVSDQTFVDQQHGSVVIIDHGELITLLQRFTVFQPRHINGRGPGDTALKPDRLALCLLQTADFLWEGWRCFGLCGTV